MMGLRFSGLAVMFDVFCQEFETHDRKCSNLLQVIGGNTTWIGETL